jgi:hypothetical protein
MAWPPAMPREPDAVASSAACRAGAPVLMPGSGFGKLLEGQGLQGVADQQAVASSNSTWQVGLPRRRTSSSMQGMSSWTSE